MEIIIQHEALHSPELLDEGGKEDEEGVLGKVLPHADSPTKSKRNKLLLLDQADTSLILFKEPSKKSLPTAFLPEQPFRSELMRLLPHVRVLVENSFMWMIMSFIFDGLLKFKVTISAKYSFRITREMMLFFTGAKTCMKPVRFAKAKESLGIL